MKQYMLNFAGKCCSEVKFWTLVYLKLNMGAFANIDDVNFFPFCSPLLFFLHTSISSNNVDDDMDIVNVAALYLYYIFRAIKRAKDAIDVQRTPVRYFLIL